MSQQIHTDQAPSFPLPYSQALRAGDFVFVSGQVGVDPDTHQVAEDAIETQTAQCLRNIASILSAAGLTLDHVVKVTAHLSRLEDFPKYNRAYEALMKRPFPARTTVQSAIGDYLVEIDVIAYVHATRGNTTT